MKSRKLFFLMETIIIFLLGALPLTIAYQKGGADEMDKIIKSIIPNTFFIWYSLAFFLGFLIIGALGVFFLRKNERQRKISSSALYVLCETGSGVVNLLRASAGAMIAIPAIWIIAEPDDFAITKVAYFIMYGLLALVEAIFFQWLILVVKAKFRPLEFEFSSRNLG